MIVKNQYTDNKNLVINYVGGYIIVISTITQNRAVYENYTDFIKHWMDSQLSIDALTDLLKQMFYPTGQPQEDDEVLFEGTPMGFNERYSSYEPVWHSNKGDILVSNMKTSHIRSCISMLKEKPEVKINKQEWLKIFFGELKNRGLK